MTDDLSVVRGGVEAGGTKFVCAVGTGPDDVRDRRVIPTTTPGETLGQVADFFEEQRKNGLTIRSLGIASFGPLDLSTDSPTYGRITTTPKAGWAGTDLVSFMKEHLDVPVALDTDVNGAAYGEYRWGAGRGLHSSTYLTVGTGVGGGAVVGGQPLRGLLHPEMGHLHVRRHPDDDFPGSCPFHGDCVEGLASGPAIKARFGRSAEDLGPVHDAMVEIEAWYLAQLVTTVVYLLSPQRVILGGGVMHADGLLDAVRSGTLVRLAGALDGTAVADGIERFLVAPELGGASGVLGALALAELADDTNDPVGDLTSAHTLTD
jgi:fructokinase